MVSQTITIQLKTGLHARPASQLVALCKEFNSTVALHYGEKKAPANSILKLLSLGLSNGSQVEITVEGEDEAQALGQVLDFMKNLEE
ncbi:MAG: HPr family phosphocarrier protein [Prolixibacteraceae bacterium]|jgi:phosphotransferase system HPr (HPr) family protein|nr:HPr family phosphocarrier protein [Prolixibacteraceae bacterium]